MKVEALCSINSGQYNTGDVIDLPKHIAEPLVAAGAARPTKEAPTQKEPREVAQHIPKRPPRSKKKEEE